MAHDSHALSRDLSRRDEILATAESLIASSGLRTSLQEIATASGILTGSLYHHFDSKEALLVELVRRYHADLARVGDAGLARLDEGGAATVEDKIVELSAEIARCAVRNRAALQMSFYEAPTESAELMALLRQPPQEVKDAMVQTLRAGRWSGYLRQDLDLGPLADRICQSMLHVGLDVIRRDAPADEAAGVLCRILLRGLAKEPVDDAQLDRSAAMAAANAVIDQWEGDHWDHDAAQAGDKATHIRQSARTVFGRKGFEVTTIRDIAAAAGLNAATVYRLIGSKDQLLASIMRAFGEKTGAASVAVLDSVSSPVEKFDALAWIHINAVLRFPDEWKIQLAWLRQTPPGNPNPGHAFSQRMAQLEALLEEGITRGEIQADGDGLELLSRCVMDVLWVPENIIRQLGTTKALAMARDDVIRGIVRR